MGKPIYLKVEKTIHQPLDKVWNTVALEFGNVANYNPEIKASKYDSAVKSGIGTKRHCDFQKSGYIEEEITDWKDRVYFVLNFTESSVPMAVLQSKFSFHEKSGNTALTQEFWYRMKSPLGWLSGWMKGKMRKTLESGLNGLDNYLQDKNQNNDN